MDPASMNDLPDDAYIYIFSYLSLYNLRLAEQVCHKWRTVSSWYWKKLKQVSVSEFLNIKEPSKCERLFAQSTLKINLITESILHSLAKQCGNNLRHLESGCTMKMAVSCFNVLASEFPRLEYLDLSKTKLIRQIDDPDEVLDFDMSFVFEQLRTVRLDACLDDAGFAYYDTNTADPVIFKLFTAMPNVESASLAQNTLLNGSCLLGLNTNINSLDLGFCRRMDAETLTLVFSSLPNLRDVSLYSNNKLMGSCLSYLPINLESIELSYCDSLDADSIVSFFHTHPNLKNIQMAHTRGLTNQVIDSMAECLENLENLNLSWYLSATYYEGHLHPHDIVAGMKMLGAMKTLKRLDLSRNDFILDATLITISYGCILLEDLNVSRLDNATEIGFASLGRLGRLRKLDISDNDCVDENVLLSVAHGGNLEFVNARKCKKIELDSVKRLGEFWPNKGTIFQVF